MEIRADAQQARIKTHPNLGSSDWTWHGAKHYDIAIKLLSKGVSDLHTSITDEYQHHSLDLALQFLPSEQFDGLETDGRSLVDSEDATGTTPDNVLTAAVILCVYELLNDTRSAWAQHLGGVKRLFDMFEKTEMSDIHALDPLNIPKFSEARRATFWNFSRQDSLAACKYGTIFAIAVLSFQL